MGCKHDEEEYLARVSRLLSVETAKIQKAREQLADRLAAREEPTMRLEELREQTKAHRNFEVNTYIDGKVRLIREFFSKNKLDSCVLGVSGGVDSAAVLALLREAAKDGSIKRIWPLVIPIYSDGVTGQREATDLALRQCRAFNIEAKVVDLTAAHRAYICYENSWANGQLACILRTPALYYHAAILQTEGLNSIVVGTTDRDEGSYIGFFGKASDAMVDLQPIADIHKSEVQAVARQLGVISEIAGRTPTGDVWNGVTSEQMIGAPFWFLEMYLLLKENKQENAFEKLIPEHREIYLKHAAEIEKLHNKNYHKYQVGLPSHFIDLMPRRIPGGW